VITSELDFDLSKPLTVGLRRIAVASRKFSTAGSWGLTGLVAFVLPEFVFVEEHGYIFGIRVPNGEKVELEDVGRMHPSLMRIVLEAFKNPPYSQS
jgi:hypothetical protein